MLELFQNEFILPTQYDSGTVQYVLRSSLELKMLKYSNQEANEFMIYSENKKGM